MGLAGTQFEPHGGYGQEIDGESMPFGYLSKDGPGQPIFELRPVLTIVHEELRAYALAFAAGPDLLAAAKLMVSEHGIRGGDADELLPPNRQAFEIKMAMAAIRFAETGDRS